MRRWWIGALALLLCAAAIVQAAGDALYGDMAVAGSFPQRLVGDWPLRFAVATGLDRVPFLVLPLARGALARGDLALANRLLARLPDAPAADDVRGRAAARAGDAAAALSLYARAGDFVAARPAIDALAQRDPHAALRVTEAFERRLGEGFGAPEIAAEIAWRSGQLAATVAYVYPAEAGAANRDALAAYRRALQLAPNEETYLLAFGAQALVVGDAAAARDAYLDAVRVVPDSLDAYAGLAAAQARLGACAAAQAAWIRAATLAARAGREPVAAVRCP